MSSFGLIFIMLDGFGIIMWVINGIIIINVIVMKMLKLLNRVLFIGISLVICLIGLFGVVVNRGIDLEKLLFQVRKLM